MTRTQVTVGYWNKDAVFCCEFFSSRSKSVLDLFRHNIMEKELCLQVVSGYLECSPGPRRWKWHRTCQTDGVWGSAAATASGNLSTQSLSHPLVVLRTEECDFSGLEPAYRRGSCGTLRSLSRRSPSSCARSRRRRGRTAAVWHDRHPVSRVETTHFCYLLCDKMFEPSLSPRMITLKVLGTPQAELCSSIFQTLKQALDTNLEPNPLTALFGLPPVTAQRVVAFTTLLNAKHAILF